jgi:predicted GNAT family acetyltransferase
VDVRLHHDIAEFTALTRPLLEADPIRHSVALTVLAFLCRLPRGDEDPPVLLSVRRDGVLAATALCTPPRDLIVSGLPAECAAASVKVLVAAHPQLPGAVGPRGEAEAFAQSWAAGTGALVHERVAQRVFALHQLTPPGGVPGAARPAGGSDLELLARWRQDFADEATGGMRGHGTALQQVSRTLAAGTAAMLWEVGGQPVAWASATTPVAGMSRIGPVYTPPQHRGHGYGSAVTAAAASWAQQARAKHVVLSTDLSNPISNAIYPRIGFRPMHDAVEIAFGRRRDSALNGDGRATADCDSAPNGG